MEIEFKEDEVVALLYYFRWVLERYDLFGDVLESSLQNVKANLYSLSVRVVNYSLVLKQICVSYKKKYEVELH